MNFKSTFLQELQQRGFIAQITHIKELDELLSAEKITAYIGFDCTANCLHAGSLIQIMILRLLQKHGHKPLILLGGGTTKIGDPSGKDEARQILTAEKIAENLSGIEKNLRKFLDFDGANAAVIVNNNDWLSDLNYIDFLRDFGRHFSVNRMLGFDSVKLRLEREQNLSFLEFNYMILQAYDFYELNQKHNCRLQIGGSDQWGNIVNGVELTRRIAAENNAVNHVFGLTTPLLTTANGAKMGKTASGAVWLDSELLSPFDYFQYFRNVDDKDVGKFLRLFTDLDSNKIAELEKLQDQEINKAKEILAFETVKICHGENTAKLVLAKAQEIFINKSNQAFEEKIFIADAEILRTGIKLTEIIRQLGILPSAGEAKRMIQGRAVRINGELIEDEHSLVKNLSEFDLAIGKKKFFKVILETR